ncbi:hypothetical protein [Sphingobium chungbukense]|nr:hypothetical protein [Sphingobium chungbukense]
MTARFHIRGRDPLTVAPQTQWQAERMRGPIQPMEQPRRSWFRFRRIG